MPEVTVLRSFEHNGRRQRGATFMASEQEARKLAAAGLVSYDGQAEGEAAARQADPTETAGRARRSSASPAGRASKKTTAAKSARGGKRK